ncbi:MAG: efflux RND transporter permease subunit [candidate division Zixibacteria bacterium]|nr:efflux RND transporter permease subunit [Candidatus Tariuqbacter arcticus]
MRNSDSFLPSLSVKRPVTVLMLFLALLVTGGISYMMIPVELFPEGFTPPFLGIWVRYSRANPQENEDQIARPAEEYLRTVRGIKEITSRSSANGVWFWLEFDQDTDMDLAYSEVSDRLERARLEWPDDQRYLWINRFSDEDEPVFYFGVRFSEAVDDPHYLVEYKMKRRLERITGVAKVETWGTYEKIIQIEVDADRAKAYHINTYQLINDLMRDNFTMSSGYVMEGGHKYYLRSLGQFKSVEEIRNLPINGDNLRLCDVARVTYDVPERRSYQRIDRMPSAMIGVYKESSANTVEVAAAVGKVVEEMQAEDMFKGLETRVIFNQADFILGTVKDLKVTGLWGGLFAFGVLLFFLRRIWMTAIITLAIPMSIMISLTAIYFIGWSLNIMIMMGLMICVGLVIDNSIVVVENIHVRKLSGEEPVRAAIGGASEVSLAVTLATMTTVVVFLPLILINDDIGFSFYMLRIGLPVILALLASLLVSLLFIPLVAKHSISRKSIAEPRMIEWGGNLVQRILRWTLRRRLDATIIALLLMFSVSIPMNKIPKTDEAEGNIKDFRLIFDLPSSYTLEKSEKLFVMVEELLFSKKEEYDINTVSTRYSANWGRIRVLLNKHEQIWWQDVADKIGYGLGLKQKTVLTREEVIEDVKERMPEIPGVKMFTSWRRDTSSDNAVEVNLTGDDTQTLLELAEDVRRVLKRIPSIISVDVDLESGKDEIRISLDRKLVRRAGLTPRQVGYTVSYALRGYELPDLRTEDKEITVRTQFMKEDRETLEQLKNIRFDTPDGGEISLGALADFKTVKGLGEIRRTNGKTSLTIKATTTKDNLEALSKDIDRAMANINLPRGYGWSKGSRFMRMQESNEAQQFAIILAITFVFLLMGVLFESFILPLSVIVCIPFSFFGAYWLLFITGTPFDFMAGIGLIILIGVVVNNGIVLVDLVNRLRAQGMERTEALLTASKRRFRPICMTAMTTMFGLLPMAAGNSSLIGIPYAPLGRVIIGGIATSTIFTLVMVPLCYSFFDDLREFWKRVMMRVIRVKNVEW